MRVCIVCTSKYQIYNAIIMKNTILKGDHIDVYICNHIDDAESVSDLIKIQKIFENVFYITDINSNCIVKKMKQVIGRAMGNLSIYNYQLRNIDFKYDKMFLAINSMFATSLYEKIKLKNRNLKTYLYEDGLGSYICKMMPNNCMGKVPKLLKKIKRDIYEDIKFEGIYLYQPELYTINECNSILKLENNIEAIDRDVINKLFNVDRLSKGTINKKYIFFDQMLNDDIVRNQFEILHNTIKNELIVKAHPRHKNNLYENVNIEFLGNEPIEAYFINNLISESILITYCSTAVFNAKVIFNYDSDIILLYKMHNKLRDELEHFDDYIYKFEKITNSKIYIPKNEKELVEAIELCKRRNLNGDTKTE